MKFYVPKPAPAIESAQFKAEPSTALIPDEPVSLADILYKAQQALPVAVDTLINIINDPTQYGNTRVAAIKELREWGLGDIARSMNEAIASGKNPKEVSGRTPFERLTSEERIQRAKEVARMFVSEEDHILTDRPNDIEMMPQKDEPRN